MTTTDRPTDNRVNIEQSASGRLEGRVLQKEHLRKKPIYFTNSDFEVELQTVLLFSTCTSCTSSILDANAELNPRF